MNKSFKYLICLLANLIIITSTYAQAPNKLAYQSVIRNSSGGLVQNLPVGIKVSILQNSASGSAVYVETHNVTTNENGLANIEIGGGNVVNGSFANINWAIGNYFLKTETDVTGGTNYSISATSQLLSVPYALYAKSSGNSGMQNYSQAQIDALTPTVGMSVYNTDNNVIQYYNGTNWMVLSAYCTPQPNFADAGPDQIGLQVLNTVLQGNTPSNNETGKWTILQGSGGSFSDDTSPTSVFYGNDNTTYILQWTLSTICGSTYSYVTISFNTTTSDDIVSYSYIQLGGSSNVSLGSFFSCSNGSVYLQSSANSNQALIDIIYTYTTANYNLMASPNDSLIGTIFSNLASWSTKNNTLFTGVLSGIIWNDIIDDSIILNNVNSSTAINTRIVNLAVNDIFGFITASNKKGLIKITAISGTSGADRRIAFDVKIEL